MRFAIVENGSVVNIVEAAAPLAVNWAPDDDGSAAIGGSWDGAVFSPPPPPEKTPEALREKAIAARAAAVDAIVVTTTSGKAFDGDETSQNRMGRAIQALQAAGQPSTRWVLADNTVGAVTLAELQEALALAGAEQTRIWMEAFAQ